MDAAGLPTRLGLAPGEAHDNWLCSVLLAELQPRATLLADRGYDADGIREFASQNGAWANIPPKRNRKEPICFSPCLYRSRTWSSGFSTGSSSAGVSPPVTTSSPPTILPSSSLRLSVYGCPSMAARLWLRAYESTPWLRFNAAHSAGASAGQATSSAGKAPIDPTVRAAAAAPFRSAASRSRLRT